MLKKNEQIAFFIVNSNSTNATGHVWSIAMLASEVQKMCADYIWVTSLVPVQT